MPALPPPSLQIGALAPGFSPMPPAGPVRTPQQTPAAPVIVQSAGAHTTSSGPTNITQTITATQQGTFLVWAVAVNASAGAALGGTPAGWTLTSVSSAVATLAFAVYIYPNNPGGLTSVTFSSNATATTGGIAAWFWELDNCPATAAVVRFAAGTSTSPASGNLNPVLDSMLMLGATAWVLGTATFTSTSTGGYAWTVNAQQSSTAGTTNAAVQTGSNTVPFGTPANAAYQGTLSASAVWVAAAIGIASSASGGPVALAPSRAFVVDGGAGYAVGDAGNAGWSLGGTKPGGAGSGQ